MTVGSAKAEYFVGRVIELRAISARATAARARQQVVVIEGKPGVGKTALLTRALTELADAAQLRADGALGDVTAQLVRAAGRGPGSASSSRSRPGLLKVLGATLEASGPLVLALDNAHRIDDKSALDLSAALSALRGSALLVVAVAPDPWRQEPGSGPNVEWLRRLLLAGPALRRLYLRELSAAETGTLLAGAGIAADEQAVLGLHRYTGGHPGLLSVLLGHGQALARTPPADLLGFFDAQVMAIVAQLAALAEPSRRLLAAMAVSAEPWPLAIVGSVAGVDDPFSALEPLLDAGLAEWFPVQPVAPVSIRYPFYRDIVYRSLPPGLSQVLHERAARFAIGTRAWRHRVAASNSAEPTLALTLEREAERYFLAGDSEQAGTLLMWAASVTSSSAEQERQLLRAASWGLTLRAIDWGPRLESCLARQPQGAARSLVLGLLAQASGRYARARVLLDEAAIMAEREGRAQALRPDIDLAMALVRADLGEPDAEYRLAEGVLAVDGLSPVHRAWAQSHAVDAWGRMYGAEAALSKLAVLDPDASIDDQRQERASSQSVGLWTRGTWRLRGGRLGDGGDDLTRMLRAGDRAAVEAVVPMAHAYLGYAHFLLGDWQAAQRAVDQSIATLRGHAVVRVRIPVRAVAACVDAGAGRSESAARHLSAARHWFAELGPDDYAVFPALAAATIAQADGDQVRMLAAVRPLLGQDARAGWHEAWWRPLQVEALIGTRQVAAARLALDRLIDLAGVRGGPSVTIAWLEAALAAAGPDRARARELFDAAGLRPPAPDDVPLHRARLEHDYGRFLMSGRTRRAAIGPLRRAYELYRVLGAWPFAERCASDLEVCGIKMPGQPGNQPGDRAHAVLSSRERKIASLAAEGLTNQEISAEVFVSAKTVEYHLGNVFAKLGISSRRQLQARLGEEPGT
ncbi:MAG TPA: LuxR C-terminal-related transcriptional regulator [Streptosporangiaceae bacterium]|nr:LuxR C-terminal-related transcriptional regulator [Streptosporangiaceae bacterium]